MKVKDIKSITDERYEIVIFVPSEKFNSDKQDSYTQSKNIQPPIIKDFIQKDHKWKHQNLKSI